MSHPNCPHSVISIFSTNGANGNKKLIPADWAKFHSQETAGDADTFKSHQEEKWQFDVVQCSGCQLDGCWTDAALSPLPTHHPSGVPHPHPSNWGSSVSCWPRPPAPTSWWEIHLFPASCIIWLNSARSPCFLPAGRGWAGRVWWSVF